MAIIRRPHEGCPSILEEEEEKGHGERRRKAEGHPQKEESRGRLTGFKEISRLRVSASHGLRALKAQRSHISQNTFRPTQHTIRA